MGRPINKRYFGSPALPGKQLRLDECWFPGEVAPEPANTVYFLQQTGTGRYRVTNGTKVGIVRLVANSVAAPGEARLSVSPYRGKPVEYARTLYNRTVKTHSDNRYDWSIDTASVEGQADLNMA